MILVHGAPCACRCITRRSIMASRIPSVFTSSWGEGDARLNSAMMSSFCSFYYVNSWRLTCDPRLPCTLHHASPKHYDVINSRHQKCITSDTWHHAMILVHRAPYIPRRRSIVTSQTHDCLNSPQGEESVNSTITNDDDAPPSAEQENHDDEIFHLHNSILVVDIFQILRKSDYKYKRFLSFWIFQGHNLSLLTLVTMVIRMILIKCYRKRNYKIS